MGGDCLRRSCAIWVWLPDRLGDMKGRLRQVPFRLGLEVQRFGERKIGPMKW